MPDPCYVRFRSRSVIEMVRLAPTVVSPEDEPEPEGVRNTPQPVADEREAVATTDGPETAVTYPLRDIGYTPGWYGVDRHLPVRVRCVEPDGAGLRLVFAPGVGATVTPDAIDLTPDLSDARPARTAVPVRLEDGLITPRLLDPARCFFRRPEEAGFWERIVTDVDDATARLVYADWLDDHDDPHAWVFRDQCPFLCCCLAYDWAGAVPGVESGPRNFWPRLWGFALVPGRYFPLALADRTPVPKFVAYLLALTCIRIAWGRAGAVPPVLPPDIPGNGSFIRLVCPSGGFEGREWSFDAPFEVGRRPAAGLVLDGEAGRSVSRTHATVFHAGAGWWVADRGSTHGTWLNGTPVGTEPAGPLRPGNVLQFAQVVLQVAFAAPAAADTRPGLAVPVLAREVTTRRIWG